MLTTTVAPVTGTETSRVGLLAIVVVTALVAGCGGGGPKSNTRNPYSSAGTAPASAIGTSEDAFAWLRPLSPPAGWPSADTPSGASIAYPPGWRRIAGDPGTATAALSTRASAYVGYLNLTPRQGAETLSDWIRFRIEHNRDEGDRTVRALAKTTGRRVGKQTFSCVLDSYTTAVRSDYVEIACLLKGPRSTVVVVGATPPQSWSAVSPLLKRAIASARA